MRLGKAARIPLPPRSSLHALCNQALTSRSPKHEWPLKEERWIQSNLS